MTSLTSAQSASIARYLNVQAAYYPAFLAEQVAFISNLTGVPQVFRVRLPAAGGPALWPDQLTFEQDRVQGVWSAPVGSRLIFTRDQGGNENAQLWLLDDAQEINLTPGFEKAMHIFGGWSKDGQQIVFAANRRDPALFDVYIQPLNGAARLAWQNDKPGFLFDMTFSPDGNRLAVVRAGASFQHDLIEIDLKNGQMRLLSPPDSPARYSAVHYAHDGRALYFITDFCSDFMYAARLDLANPAIESLVAPNWDVDYLALSPDGQKLAYTVNKEGASTLHVRDLKSRSDRTAPLPGDVPGVVGFYDFHLTFAPDSQRLGFSFTSATRTSDVYIWDLTADTVQAVTRSSHAGLPSESFRAPELIRYPTFDKDRQGATRLIPGWFTRPAVSGPVPAVIIVHGGPEGQTQPYFNFLVQYFVNNGYAVLAPNVRGSTGYGKEYSHLDDVEKRMDSVADLAQAARWLRNQPGIDGKRIAVYGGSYGGFMVLAALTTYPDLFNAGVDIVGISNFVTFLENTSAYRRTHRESEYGSLKDNRDFLQKISPLNHADKIIAPLMVIHGANDPRVPLSEAKQLVANLRERGRTVEFQVFDDEGHGLVKLKNKLVAYPAIVAFLKQHLGK